MPQRLQRRRTKGYRLPEGAISVTRPGPYGNPFRVGDTYPTPDAAVRAFRIYAEHKLRFDPDWLEPLRGKDLACFCPLVDERGHRVPCHADVLLELLTAEEAAA